MNETRALARFVADTTFADLPRGLVENCKLTVLDALGAGFVGAVQPWAQRIVSVVRAQGGAPEASVIHQDWRTDAARAALANGVLIGAFECEPLTGSHAAGTVLPAALAVAQRERLGGAAFLTAMALGFEVSGRLAHAATGLETARGFHNPSAHGPFGAAAAVAKLYALDADRITSALGIAGSSSAGLLEFAWAGGDTKRLHLGRASQLGLESALLARAGVNGPATVLEGRSGYFNAFSTAPAKATLVQGLGTRWEIEPPWVKSYATHVTHQAVVAAIQEFKREQPLDPRAITKVVISGAPRIMEERHTTREPQDVLGGQYSLPFTTAVALTRDMANPLVYNDEAVQDPLVRDLARRIELVPVDGARHEAPGVWPSEILIECAGKRHTLVTRPYKGSSLNPFTWDDACEKFRRFTASVIAAERQTAIIDAIGRLEHVADMAEVAQLSAPS
ncbi:MAG TPA: MmgE/PrpD family protein [Candidatus Limnocylindrales bacterium]|nr:MmgE/PrpD family protein [Candidatus Limnocylindrales bacterium]